MFSINNYSDHIRHCTLAGRSLSHFLPRWTKSKTLAASRRTMSSQSSHHPQEVLLAQFSLYVHKGGLKPDSFHFRHEKAAHLTVNQRKIRYIHSLFAHVKRRWYALIFAIMTHGWICTQWNMQRGTSSNAGLMVCQRLRRWHTIKPALGRRFERVLVRQCLKGVIAVIVLDMIPRTMGVSST